MRPSRRQFVRVAGVAPVLACAALFAPRGAHAATEPGPGAFGDDRRTTFTMPGTTPVPADPRATCPFCKPNQPCPEHLL